MGILRKISFALTEAIFSVIPSVYDIFERIGSHEFFSSETIQNISNNIYILVSVCMLFAFGIKLINTIVNPDLVDNKQKGTGKTFINGVIAVVLISTIPFIFNLLYKAQNTVIEKKLIQQIVFGTDGDYKPGDLLAGYAFGAFCYPNEEVSNKNLASTGGNYYNKVIKGEINYIGKVGDAINDEINGEYELNYHIILSPLSGGYLLYQLILMCIDVAFRSVKLGILQLMAPLVICAFIFSGTELLSKWVKEVISTYVLLFAKVAAITFMVYALSLLPDLFERMNLVDSTRDTWAIKGFIRVAFIIGLLQLVNKLPEIINSIFGTKLDTKDGGISGRLAAMAGVGGVAQRAWDTFRRHPLQTAARPAGVVLGVGGNIANRMGTTAANLRNAVQQSGVGSGHGPLGSILRGGAFAAGLVGGAFSGVGTSIGAGRRGWSNGIAAAGREAAYYRDTHQPGSNMWQRTAAGAARTLGFRTPYERRRRNDNYIDIEEGTPGVSTAYNGMTLEQLDNLRNEHDGFIQRRNAIREAAVHSIEEEDSNIRMTINGLGTGNYQQLRRQLETIRNAVPERQNFAANAQGQAAYEQAVQDHAQHITNLEQNLIELRNSTRDSIVDTTLQHDGITTNDDVHGTVYQRDANGNIMTDANGNNIVAGHVLNDSHVLGRDAGIITTNTRTLRGMGETARTNAVLNDHNLEHQGEVNDIDTVKQTHQRQVYNDQNSEESRTQQASQASVDARRNNRPGNGGGGGNAGGGHH